MVPAPPVATTTRTAPAAGESCWARIAPGVTCQHRTSRRRSTARSPGLAAPTPRVSTPLAATRRRSRRVPSARCTRCARRVCLRALHPPRKAGLSGDRTRRAWVGETVARLESRIAERVLGLDDDRLPRLDPGERLVRSVVAEHPRAARNPVEAFRRRAYPHLSFAEWTSRPILVHTGPLQAFTSAAQADTATISSSSALSSR